MKDTNLSLVFLLLQTEFQTTYSKTAASVAHILPTEKSLNQVFQHGPPQHSFFSSASTKGTSTGLSWEWAADDGFKDLTYG